MWIPWLKQRGKRRACSRGTTKPRFPIKVEIDNSTSDSATIVEVYAHDRPGLLYDITRRLSVMGLNIVLAKISTEVDQAADIFYIQDQNGNKIIDFDEIDSIRDELIRHLIDMEKDASEKTSPSQITF